MSQFVTILNQIGVFIILLAIGVILRKAGILNEGSLRSVSDITLKVALPAFIFTSTVSSTTLKDYKNAVPAILVFLCVYVLIYFLGHLISRLFGLRGNSARAFRLCMTFGNVGLVGVPIVTELYPRTAMIIVAISTVLDMTLLWTYGVSLSYDVESPDARKREGFSVKKVLKILLNPPLLAIIISLVFIALDLSVPSFINTTLQKVGAMLSPLGMIYVGGILSWPDIKYALKQPVVYAHIIIKMILIPTAVFFIMIKAGIAEDMSGTTAIILSVPVFIAATMLAKNNGSDYKLASGMVMLSTLAFMITYPVTSLLISLIPV